MKRIICMILVLALFSAQASLFEPKKKGFFESFGEKLDEATAKAWDWTKENTDIDWDWTGKKASELWDSVSTSASELWGLTGESGEELLADLESWLDVTGKKAQETLKAAFEKVCEGYGIAKEQTEYAWKQVTEYAKRNDIKPLTMGKLSVAGLIFIVAGEYAQGTAVEAFAYEGEKEYFGDALVAWLRNNGVNDESSAEELLTQMRTSLKEHK